MLVLWKKNFFDVDIVVKSKSMCSLAWPALLSTTIRCHHSGQNVVDSRRCAFCNKRSRRSLVSDLPSPPSPPSRRRTCFQRKERGLLSRTAAGNRLSPGAKSAMLENKRMWQPPKKSDFNHIYIPGSAKLTLQHGGFSAMRPLNKSFPLIA